MIVLDSSALLAWFKGEDGAAVVDEHIDGAIMSAVNVTEVVTRLIDLGIAEDDAQLRVSAIGVTIDSFTPALAFRAARLRDATRAAGLSIGDRACIATAEARGMAVLSGDHDWRKVTLPVPVIYIREPSR